MSKRDKDDHKKDAKIFALCVAAGNNQLDEVRKLIDSGVDINGYNKSDKTALYYAVYKSHFKIVEYLLSKGASINDTYDGRASIFHIAVRHSTLPILQELIKHIKNDGANLSDLDSGKNTSLHLAVENKKIDMLIYLAQKHDFLLSIQNSEGKKPLDLACECQKSFLMQQRNEVNPYKKIVEILKDAIEPEALLLPGQILGKGHYDNDAEVPLTGVVSINSNGDQDD